MILHSPTILIVEDEVLTAMEMEAMVEDLGYRVLGPYHNLREALDHAGRDHIDLALLDFDLGHGANAIPIAERLMLRHIPFVFTSGTRPDYIRQFLPGAMVLTKPVAAAALEQVLP